MDSSSTEEWRERQWKWNQTVFRVHLLKESDVSQEFHTSSIIGYPFYFNILYQSSYEFSEETFSVDAITEIYSNGKMKAYDDLASLSSCSQSLECEHLFKQSTKSNSETCRQSTIVALVGALGCVILLFDLILSY